MGLEDAVNRQAEAERTEADRRAQQAAREATERQSANAETVRNAQVILDEFVALATSARLRPRKIPNFGHDGYRGWWIGPLSDANFRVTTGGDFLVHWVNVSRKVDAFHNRPWVWAPISPFADDVGHRGKRLFGRGRADVWKTSQRLSTTADGAVQLWRRDEDGERAVDFEDTLAKLFRDLRGNG